MTAPHCRLSFSLSGLLVLITFVCGWLGCERLQMYRRSELRAWIVANGGGLSRFDEEGVPQDVLDSVANGHQRQVSFVRRWMGDDGVMIIAFPRRDCVSDERRVELVRLFPEAQIVWVEDMPAHIRKRIQSP